MTAATNPSTAADCCRSSPQQSSIFDLLDQGDVTLEPANSQPGRVDYTKTGKPVRHGTNAGYTKHGCRCEACREWNSEYRRRRREQLRQPGKPIPHGTRSGYDNYGCRCDECRDWQRENSRRRREQLRQSDKPILHGTASGYKDHGCRCEACRYWQRENSRRYRERLRQSDSPIPHGTAAGYRDHGCRCDECRDWRREYERRWRRDNPTKARSIWATRRARKKAAFVEHVDYAVVFERCEGRCQLCGKDLRGSPRRAYEFDHIWPLARYGTHHYGNLRLLCRRCNGSKWMNPEQPWHVWLTVAHHSFWRRLDLDLDLVAAPADPWTDLDPTKVVPPLERKMK